ncbi:hypothetical protein NDU88_004177 [Pleurodeles waltl]|uniref:Uncharacterized protein n=1 Tax=Pleurodeles waltl TaxID=8319 RepID=A0AAV7WUK4_PLEWA|nr:hypothetical protein NDU88_004177 [Pleurodeles waltl]
MNQPRTPRGNQQQGSPRAGGEIHRNTTFAIPRKGEQGNCRTCWTGGAVCRSQTDRCTSRERGVEGSPCPGHAGKDRAVTWAPAITAEGRWPSRGMGPPGRGEHPEAHAPASASRLHMMEKTGAKYMVHNIKCI